MFEFYFKKMFWFMPYFQVESFNKQFKAHVERRLDRISQNKLMNLAFCMMIKSLIVLFRHAFMKKMLCIMNIEYQIKEFDLFFALHNFANGFFCSMFC